MQIADLAEKYQISEVQLKTRVNFLGLKPIKTLTKSPFFSPRDVTLLDDLHQHLVNNGKFNSYLPPSFNELTAKTKQTELTTKSIESIIAERTGDNSQTKINSMGSHNNTKVLEMYPRHTEEQVTTGLEIEDVLEIMEKEEDQAYDSLVSNDNENLATNLAEVTSYALYPDAINKEIEDYFALNQRLKYNGILEELASRGWGLTAREIQELTGSKPSRNYYQYDCFIFIKQGKIGNKITWRVVKKSVQPINDTLRDREPRKVNQQHRYRNIEQEIKQAEQDFVQDIQLVL